MKRYIVEEVPANMGRSESGEKLYYCHMRDYPNIPVFGSIGSKSKANAICRQMNLNFKK